jgi:hypothetical protein
MYKTVNPLLLFAVLFIAACSNDDPAPTPNNCTSEAFGMAFNEAIMELGDAAAAFGADPTQANCDAWRDAANNYLDVVQGFETCSVVNNTQEYRDALAAARDEVNNFTCN